MKQLHQKVNIVPVIARADALTKKEVTELKKRVSKCRISTIYYHRIFDSC
jgi:septin family protein